jgi:pimeloyl-ACP methyl ester carboxylesterase
VERLIAAGATEEDEALPPPNQNRERADLRATLDELRAMAWRTTIPLVVITRGTTMRSSYPHLTDEQVRRVEAAWRGLQRDLARRSSKGELMIAARSGHNVQADEPEVVIGAVREVVEQVRSQ